MLIRIFLNSTKYRGSGGAPTRLLALPVIILPVSPHCSFEYYLWGTGRGPMVPILRLPLEALQLPQSLAPE